MRLFSYMKIISAGIIIKDDKVLICQRRKNSYYELKWEFPGGKVEEDEDTIGCLKRELEEELDINADIDKLIYVQKFKYPDGFEFEISFYLIKHFEGTLKNKVFENILWVSYNELKEFDFLEADKEVIDHLLTDNVLYN
jgi:8-oxo-dGTP diphosphatase